jgi:hypothetical protein
VARPPTAATTPGDWRSQGGGVGPNEPAAGELHQESAGDEAETGGALNLPAEKAPSFYRGRGQVRLRDGKHGADEAPAVKGPLRPDDGRAVPASAAARTGRNITGVGGSERTTGTALGGAG